MGLRVHIRKHVFSKSKKQTLQTAFGVLEHVGRGTTISVGSFDSLGRIALFGVPEHVGRCTMVFRR